MYIWWDIIVGIILGIVEGITEFLPVSSTGHMIIVGEQILHIPQGVRMKTFEVVIQLGSILAVIVVFWDRLLRLAGLRKADVNVKKQLTLVHIIIAIIPATILGFLTHSFIKEVLFSTKTVIFSLIAGGILMIFAEKFITYRQSKDLDQISYKQALIVGLFQCFALCPGFSRAGATISGGLIAGIHHRAAAEFSFIVAVPMMIGATGLDLIKNWDSLSRADLPLFITGFVTAFVVGIIAIKFFLELISKINLTPFAIYRFIVAGILAYFLWF